MGCGKSSVGRKLSALLSCSYIDLDSVIEEKAGRSIPEIFADDGEAVFRRMELEALYNVIRDCQNSIPGQSHTSQANGSSPCPRVEKCQFHTPASYSESAVLSLGGGTVMTPECAELVHENTLCIHLSASVDTLMSHLEDEAEGRPMLSPVKSGKTDTTPSDALRSRISELMDKRSETYEKTAHVIIDTDGKSINEIAEEIVIEFHRARAYL